MFSFTSALKAVATDNTFLSKCSHLKQIYNTTLISQIPRPLNRLVTPCMKDKHQGLAPRFCSSTRNNIFKN